MKQEWHTVKVALDQANRRQKPGLVWRNRKKISQIIKDYFYLPFFLLIIFWEKYTIRIIFPQLATNFKPANHRTL
jgi:hypothetical protein